MHSTVGPRPTRSITTPRLPPSGLLQPRWPRRLSMSRNWLSWTWSVDIRSCRLLVLGDVLGRDARWVARRRKALLDRRLLRLVTDKEVHWSGRGRGDLLELTPAGLRTLAAHLGLSLASAVSQHGLAGGGPESPIGTRRTLLTHLDHTVGADAVFGLLARA